MGLNMLSYSQLTLIAGGILLVAGIITLIAGTIVFSIKRKKVKTELIDKYGF